MAHATTLQLVANRWWTGNYVVVDIPIKIFISFSPISTPFPFSTMFFFCLAYFSRKICAQSAKKYGFYPFQSPTSLSCNTNLMLIFLCPSYQSIITPTLSPTYSSLTLVLAIFEGSCESSKNKFSSFLPCT